jgi:PAS domain S-box-containing protein
VALEIDESKRELSRVKGLLKNEPRGLSITDVSRILNMNRNSVSKYLNMLLVSGHVDMRAVGVAKVYFLSQRVPISAMLDFSSDCIIVLDENLKIVQLNDNYVDFSGYSREELIGTSLLDRELPVLTDAIDPHIFEEVLRGQDLSRELWWEADGEDFSFLIKMIPTVFDDGQPGATVILENITDLKRTEQELKLALAEKEGLLTEIHQRIRNNLQVISSLINLQTSEVKDPDAQRIVQQTQSRIEALALVHDNLHNYPDHMHIAVEEYVNELVGSLFATYRVPADQIRYTVNAPGVVIGLDTAVSFGLIVSELVTNAIKHAFPDKREGVIAITIVKDDGNRVVVSVKDNGIGIGDRYCSGEKRSIGLMLVSTLVDRQLNGTMEVSNKNGTSYMIQFIEQDEKAGVLTKEY